MLSANATDPASSSGHNEGSGVHQSVLVGSFNLPEQGDGVPDIGRILSAVLGSIGINSTSSGSQEITFNELAAERAYSISGRQQPDQTGMRDQPLSNTSTASYPVGSHSYPLQPPVIHDSLTTLTQYLRHLRQEYDTNVRGQNNTSHTAEPRGVVDQGFHAAATGPAGLPTPESMAEVLLATRQLLTEQIEECLLQVARHMENQANVSDPEERSRIQANAFRSGRLVQNFGALLLELGRSMMTLQMGPTPADAVVNTGPALFVSMTGPNPIMVQPLPFLPGTSVGAVPVGTPQHSSGVVGGSVGSGTVPRNINIRIHSGIGRMDPTRSPQTSPPNINNTLAHDVGRRDPASSPQTIPPNINSTPAQGMTSEGTGRSSVREPGVRVVPLRSLYAAAPTPVGPAATDSTHGSFGMFYPVLTRVHPVSSGNPNNSRSPQVPGQHAHIVINGRSSILNPAAQMPTSGLPGLDMLRNIFSGGHQNGQNVYPQHVVAGTENIGVATDINNSQEPTLSASEDGVLLSNILHHIMPLISETIGTTSNVSSAGGENAFLALTQVPASSEEARSSRRQRDPPSPPSPKRQKRE